MAEPWKILCGPANEIEPQVNEASENYQALSFTVLAIKDQAVVTVVMQSKRELARLQAQMQFNGSPIMPMRR